LAGDGRELIGDQRPGAFGQDAGKLGQLLLDDQRIGDKSVQRHRGAERREHRQHRIEGNAGGDDRDVVLRQLGLDAPQDVAPAANGDLVRRVGGASAPIVGHGAADGLGVRAPGCFPIVWARDLPGRRRAAWSG
jgi:hypothetical protein